MEKVAVAKLKTFNTDAVINSHSLCFLRRTTSMSDFQTYKSLYSSVLNLENREKRS